MVRESHLQILKKGVEIWNKWRQENPSIEPNLRGADLGKANLYGVNFGEAHLVKANLFRANLREANLSGAWLHEADFRFVYFNGADLSGTCLRGAELFQAKLPGVNLEQADLSYAKLRQAVLSGANLRGAELREANLSETDFSGADLGGANLFSATLFGANLGEANLENADLSRVILTRANLRDANLVKATLSEAKIPEADLSGADLRGAKLNGANLMEANLVKAKLSGADLSAAFLYRADLVDAELNGANLSAATLVETKLNGATLTGCTVYGISAWKLKGLEEAEQSNLVITPINEPKITVDDLEIAQFIYLVLHSEKIRNVINTIGKKGVLILGRFTERKPVLEAIRTQLHNIGYVPIVFDFTRPTDRDFTETVKTLAGMSRFIIADITKPKSVPLELQAIVPDYMIPMVPLIEKGEKPFSMFQDLWIKYRTWVFEPLVYDSIEQLQRVFQKAVVDPANQRLLLLRKRKAEEIKFRDASDFEWLS